MDFIFISNNDHILLAKETRNKCYTACHTNPRDHYAVVNCNQMMCCGPWVQVYIFQ